MNIDAAFSQLAGWGATWVLWLLIALSVSGLAVATERAIFFMRTASDIAALRKRLTGELYRGGREPGLISWRKDPSFEAQVLAAGLSGTTAREAEELMGAEQHVQRLRAEQRLSFLGTLGNNAPFVGLLGTVIGVIGAFGELHVSGGQLTGGLMAEIGEALIATAVGLLVALPAVAFYNHYQRLIQVRASQAEALGQLLTASYYRTPEEAPQSGLLHPLRRVES